MYLQDQIDTYLPRAVDVSVNEIEKWESRQSDTLFATRARTRIEQLETRINNLLQELDNCEQELEWGCQLISVVSDVFCKDTQRQVANDIAIISELKATWVCRVR
tara:strand:- start:15 stop:329 length:315 start_codon:yes stop_codon:yes gene_type:complete